jgi:hypothetical protein
MDLKTLVLGAIVLLIAYIARRGPAMAKGGDRPLPNIRIHGSSTFRAAVNEALDMIATTPSASVANRLTSITEARRDMSDRRHAHVYSRGNCTIFPRGWREVSREELAGTIVHEGGHIGTDGEAPAIAAENQFREEYRAARYPALSHGAATASPAGANPHGYGRLSDVKWLEGQPIGIYPATGYDAYGEPFTPEELAILNRSAAEDSGIDFTMHGLKLWAYSIGGGKGTIRLKDGAGHGQGTLLKMRR